MSVFRAIPEYRHMLKGGHPCSYYEDKIASKSGVEITTKRTTKKPFPRKQGRKQEEKIEITNCFSQTVKLFCFNNTSQKVSHTLRNTFKTCPIKFLHPGYAKNACSSTRWPTYKRGKEFKHISLVVPFASLWLQQQKEITPRRKDCPLLTASLHQRGDAWWQEPVWGLCEWCQV